MLKRFGELHNSLERILDGADDRPNNIILQWDAIQNRKVANSLKFGHLFQGGGVDVIATMTTVSSTKSDEPPPPKSPRAITTENPAPPIPTRKGSLRPGSPRPGTPVVVLKEDSSPKASDEAGGRFEGIDGLDLTLVRKNPDAKTAPVSPRSLLPPAPAPGLPVGAVTNKSDSLSMIPSPRLAEARPPPPNVMAPPIPQAAPAKLPTQKSLVGSGSSSQLPTATQESQPPAKLPSQKSVVGTGSTTVVVPQAPDVPVVVASVPSVATNQFENDWTVCPETPTPPPLLLGSVDWTATVEPTLEPCNAIEFIDLAYHFSAEKALVHFSSLCKLQVRVSSHLKMVFKIPPALLRFMDEIHCNPNLRVYRDEASGAFTVEFAGQSSSDAPATRVFELMKFSLKTKFPLDRVPLRLVPSVVSPLQFQVLYEMNPVFDSIATLRLTIVCRPVVYGARVVSASCEKGKTSKSPLEGGVEWDPKRGVLECVVQGINKELRRDKLVFIITTDVPTAVTWGGVSCEFELGKSLLPNMCITLDAQESSEDVRVLSSKSICHRYYAK